MFLLGGITFSISLLSAEWFYAKALQDNKLENRMDDLNLADTLYPYDYLFRTGPGVQFGKLALADNKFKKGAMLEIFKALDKDPYSPELLAMMVVLKLTEEKFDEKVFVYFERLKLVNKKSPLLNIINNTEGN